MLMNTNTYQLLHVIMDGLVLLLILYLLKSKKGNAPEILPEEIINAMEKTIEHAREINEQFEATLSERKVIIEKLVEELDKKITRGIQTVEKLEQMQANQYLNQDLLWNNLPSDDLISKILTNMDQGLTIDEIASKYNKPRGEVELIVKLYSQGRPHPYHHGNRS